jgi:P-type Ca2+ transporter type 2C
MISSMDRHHPDAMPTSIEMTPAAGVYSALGTQPEGLSREQASDRLERFGPNTISEVRGKSLLVKFLANFIHLVALLLWTAGLVALIARMPQLAISIWTVNIINGAFSHRLQAVRTSMPWTMRR